LLILLTIVLLLFGVGRIGRIASELGKGIRDFRRGLSDEEEKERAKTDDEARTQKV
jgi:sec-independent protein translocase protein TatA